MNDIAMATSMLNRLVSALDWLGITFTAFMFIAAIWKPQRIASPMTFRMAVILFAFSIITPATVSGTWNLSNIGETPDPTSQYSTRISSGPSQTMVRVMNASSDGARILLGLAIALGVLSLVEGDRPRMVRRSEGIGPPAA